MKLSVFDISRINLITNEEHFGMKRKTTQLLTYKEIVLLKFINREVLQLTTSILIVIPKVNFQISNIEF